MKEKSWLVEENFLDKGKIFSCGKLPWWRKNFACGKRLDERKLLACGNLLDEGKISTCVKPPRWSKNIGLLKSSLIVEK